MRLAFGVEYDGSGFCGWQRQDEGRTVQASVEAALSFVADHAVSVVCAGRTDTGVHATGQVIHIDTVAERADKAWVMGVNSRLPNDVRMHWIKQVDEDFHARFSARRRYYRYVILNSRVNSALLGNRCTWEYHDLDEDRMAAAAGLLTGEHDFASYRALACQAKSAIRTIHELKVTRSGQLVFIDVVANAFLHHMVRCIAGVLMCIGRGEADPAWAGEVLAARDRSLGGVTAAASGLYLVKVDYPGKYSLPAGVNLPVLVVR
jgi:tRNA pseudouridine38-40 synthase